MDTDSSEVPRSGLSYLNASWRGNYIERAVEEQRATPSVDRGRPTSCVFCKIFAEPVSADDANLVAFRGESVNVLLNAYPYSSGHTMVIPQAHVGSISELSGHARAELWELVELVSAALGTAYKPDAQNIGINMGAAAGAGIPDHLHVHLVPRWSGDTNFMTALASTRVAPEALAVSHSKVRTAIESFLA